MKIGIITHNFPRSKSDRKNAGIFVYDLAQELSKKNQVFILAPGIKTKLEKFDSIMVSWFKWNEGISLGNLKLWKPKDLIKFIKFFNGGTRNLSSFYNQNKPDVIIAMWAFPSGFFSYILKKRYGVPYLVWSLGSDIYVFARKPILGIFIKKILREALYLLADGFDLKNHVSKISSKECLFVPSASKINDTLNLTNQQKKDTKKIVLTFVGRMEKVKGPDILIDSLLKIKDKLSRFDVNLIGDGSMLPKLKIVVANLGLGYAINFFGNISDQKKLTLILQKSDWVIIPSRSDSIPLVFSEAMKTKTPVIVSDLEDFKYLIKKYKVGFLFKKENSFDLANILENLEKNNQDYINFKDNTLTAAKVFSIEESVKKLLIILKNEKE